jgi:RNA polymerase-binding transcription factor DksA
VDTATARERLEAIQRELDKSISVLKGEHDDDDWKKEYPQDPADAGANLSESQRSEAILAVAMLQRSEVLDALRRIDQGTYGTCPDCGKGLPEGRLEAKPAAVRCVACQARRDRARR